MNSDSPQAAGPPPFEIFEAVYRRHGHRCPMSTLGVRLGYAARQLFQSQGGSPGLLAFFSPRTCAVDGIELTTGCSREAGTLVVGSAGHHALTLGEKDAETAIEVSLSAKALAMAGEYRQLSQALVQARPGLCEDELAAREKEREAFLDRLLERLRTLDDEELLNLKDVQVDPALWPPREDCHA